MSDHLPECPVNNIDIAGLCMCHELRACEQRVFKKAREAISWTQDIDDALDALDALAAIDALKEKP